MATYKDIEAANKTIAPTDIKGKDYAEVPQRIKAFRMVYPMGYIGTNMISNEGGVCIFIATVGYRDENGNLQVLGTGTAYEKEGSTFINKTSYIENCETSAVGRALGMAGFGIDTSVASAEEVQNAMANQTKKATPQKKNEPPKTEVKPEDQMTKPEDIIDAIHVKSVRERIKSAEKKGKTLEESALCKMLHIEKLEDMNFGQFRWFNDMMEKSGV